MIMLDRKNARSPNGLVFGTPGGGKSFSCKREMIGVLLKTHDHVLVCDPEGEYAPLVKLLHGQIIKLSPTSHDYLNPLDINLNYSEDENPLALKSDFVLSLCELIMGGKTGLEAIERTVIDRAVQRIYQPYFADPRPENMPILSDLHAALTEQHLPEADRVAQALDLYVSGSLNFFNNRTTVDIDNRFVCFDIKELPKNLKKPGNGTHFVAEVSPWFERIASSKEHERLFALLPYKTLYLSSVKDRHGVFAFISKDERRDLPLRKQRPSVRAQLKKGQSKKTAAPKKAAAKAKDNDLEV